MMRRMGVMSMRIMTAGRSPMKDIQHLNFRIWTILDSAMMARTPMIPTTAMRTWTIRSTNSDKPLVWSWKKKNKQQVPHEVPSTSGFSPEGDVELGDYDGDDEEGGEEDGSDGDESDGDEREDDGIENDGIENDGTEDDETDEDESEDNANDTDWREPSEAATSGVSDSDDVKKTEGGPMEVPSTSPESSGSFSSDSIELDDDGQGQHFLT
ncbi:hypothetical protein QBC45DRAFT_199290 [Copromyces sp. CBS 386.78]|nr:hypothetical protein QBC45DRAFT_199290 [Copromyces sp. CBS 386.78]